MKNTPKQIVLPKGTIVHLAGIPCELAEDTIVHSASLEDYTFLKRRLLEVNNPDLRQMDKPPNW